MPPADASFRSFAVVPAAGRSVRMGEPKLLLPWGPATLIEHVLAQWRAGGVTRIVATVHPDDRRLAALCRGAGAEVVVPDPPPPQMKDSVQAALAHVAAAWAPAPADVWLLAPADLPGLAPEVIAALLAAHDPAAPQIVAPYCGPRRGHPVLFPWPLAAQVERLTGEEGVRDLVLRHGHRRLECGPRAVAQDVDTPADYRRLSGR